MKIEIKSRVFIKRQRSDTERFIQFSCYHNLKKKKVIINSCLQRNVFNQKNVRF